MVWHQARIKQPFFSFPDRVDLPAAVAAAANWIEANPTLVLAHRHALTRQGMTCEPARPAAYRFSPLGRIYCEARVDSQTGRALLFSTYGKIAVRFIEEATIAGTIEEIVCALRTLQPRGEAPAIVERVSFHQPEGIYE